MSKVVDVALLALDFSSWEVSAPKKVGIFNDYWLQRIQCKARKEKKHKSRHQKNITPEKKYNPWKKIKFQIKRNYNYNAFFTKKMYILFLFVFPFFHLKKKSIYTTLVFTLGIYTFLFFLMEKRKNKQKKYVHFFCEKGIIIIVPFFLELYFFPGIIFFFRGYIFLVPRFVFFFFPRFESFGANNF